MKKRQSGFVSITVVILLVIATGAIAFSASRIMGSSDEQVSTNVNEQITSDELAEAANNSASSESPITMVLDIEIDQDAFYSVALEDGAEYYGKIQGINDDYFRISPVYYLEGGTLRILGNELHGPENAVYVNSDTVTSFSELEAGETKAAIVQSFEQDQPAEVIDALPSRDIDAYINDELLQAVFFKEGTSYFANVSSIEPLTFKGSVYKIRSSPGSGTQPNISLELVSDTEVKSSSSKELIFWENLKPDGQISTAVSQFELNQ